MSKAVRLITRITAVVGALLVFGFVFMFLDFFVIHMVDGAPTRIVVLATSLTALIAFLPAASSYRATISRDKKVKTRSVREGV